MRLLRSTAGRAVACVLVCLILGWASRPLVSKSSESSRVSFELADLNPSLSFAVLGALRQAVANYLWLSAYGSWEARDIEAVQAKFQLAVSVDPNKWFFWSNGARMMAYDFPSWELASTAASDVEEARVRAFDANEAIHWLSAAAEQFPDDYRVQLEEGMIRLHVLHDPRSAAAAFRAAWDRPGAPLFTARIYAELMRKVGEPEVAYAWYCEWLMDLPPEAKATQVGIILPRIRALEEVLAVAPERQFHLPQGES